MKSKHRKNKEVNYIKRIQSSQDPSMSIQMYKNGDIYMGRLLKNIKTDLGIFISHKGVVFEGTWNRGVFDGVGYQNYKGGRTYTGEYYQGAKHGIGRLIDKGADYLGEFVNGRRSGVGILKDNKGRVIKGFYKKGSLDGYAFVEIQKCGYSYKGRFQSGFFHGVGEEINKNTRYFGNFSKGKKHGIGFIKKDQEKKFLGHWVNDDRQGYGIEHFSNRDLYEGDFSRNERTGVGRYLYKKEGFYYIGDFERGRRSGFGKLEGEEMIYIGWWKRNRRDGLGYQKMANGRAYFGFWRDDRRHGLGYEFTSKLEYKGEWKDDKPHGKGILVVDRNESHPCIFQKGVLVDSFKYGVEEFVQGLDELNLNKFFTDSDSRLFNYENYIEDNRNLLELDYASITFDELKVGILIDKKLRVTLDRLGRIFSELDIIREELLEAFAGLDQRQLGDFCRGLEAIGVVSVDPNGSYQRYMDSFDYRRSRISPDFGFKSQSGSYIDGSSSRREDLSMKNYTSNPASLGLGTSNRKKILDFRRQMVEGLDSDDLSRHSRRNYAQKAPQNSHNRDLAFGKDYYPYFMHEQLERSQTPSPSRAAGYPNVSVKLKITRLQETGRSRSRNNSPYRQSDRSPRRYEDSSRQRGPHQELQASRNRKEPTQSHNQARNVSGYSNNNTRSSAGVSAYMRRNREKFNQYNNPKSSGGYYGSNQGYPTSEIGGRFDKFSETADPPRTTSNRYSAHMRSQGDLRNPPNPYKEAFPREVSPALKQNRGAQMVKYVYKKAVKSPTKKIKGRIPQVEYDSHSDLYSYQPKSPSQSGAQGYRQRTPSSSRKDVPSGYRPSRGNRSPIYVEVKSVRESDLRDKYRRRTPSRRPRRQDYDSEKAERRGNYNDRGISKSPIISSNRLQEVGRRSGGWDDGRGSFNQRRNTPETGGFEPNSRRRGSTPQSRKKRDGAYPPGSGWQKEPTRSGERYRNPDGYARDSGRPQNGPSQVDQNLKGVVISVPYNTIEADLKSNQGPRDPNSPSKDDQAPANNYTSGKTIDVNIPEMSAVNGSELGRDPITYPQNTRNLQKRPDNPQHVQADSAPKRPLQSIPTQIEPPQVIDSNQTFNADANPLPDAPKDDVEGDAVLVNPFDTLDGPKDQTDGQDPKDPNLGSEEIPVIKIEEGDNKEMKVEVNNKNEDGEVVPTTFTLNLLKNDENGQSGLDSGNGENPETARFNEDKNKGSGAGEQEKGQNLPNPFKTENGVSEEKKPEIEVEEMNPAQNEPKMVPKSPQESVNRLSRELNLNKILAINEADENEESNRSTSRQSGRPPNAPQSHISETESQKNFRKDVEQCVKDELKLIQLGVLGSEYASTVNQDEQTPADLGSELAMSVDQEPEAPASQYASSGNQSEVKRDVNEFVKDELKLLQLGVLGSEYASSVEATSEPEETGTTLFTMNTNTVENGSGTAFVRSQAGGVVRGQNPFLKQKTQPGGSSKVIGQRFGGTGGLGESDQGFRTADLGKKGNLPSVASGRSVSNLGKKEVEESPGGRVQAGVNPFKKAEAEKIGTGGFVKESPFGPKKTDSAAKEEKKGELNGPFGRASPFNQKKDETEKVEKEEDKEGGEGATEAPETKPQWNGPFGSTSPFGPTKNESAAAKERNNEAAPEAPKPDPNNPFTNQNRGGGTPPPPPKPPVEIQADKEAEEEIIEEIEQNELEKEEETPNPAEEEKKEDEKPTEENKEPAPAVEENKEPALAVEENQEAPVIEENKEPVPAVEENQEPAPAVEENKEPALAVEENQEPSPAAEENKEPAPAVESQEVIAAEENQAPPAEKEPEKKVEELIEVDITPKEIDIIEKVEEIPIPAKEPENQASEPNPEEINPGDAADQKEAEREQEQPKEPIEENQAEGGAEGDKKPEEGAENAQAENQEKLGEGGLGEAVEAPQAQDSAPENP